MLPLVTSGIDSKVWKETVHSMTTYTSGTWGWQAKARSKRRLQYFREYRKKHPVKPQLGFRILGKFDLEGLLQRSHGNCEACGSNKKLLVHHINKDTADNRLENLQLLCRGYHNKVHLRPKVRLLHVRNCRNHRSKVWINMVSTHNQ